MYQLIESSLFSRHVYDHLNEEEYVALQWHLMVDPAAGDVIRGTGGVRKLRWAAKGKGKRGGIRVIYYWQNSAGEIWLLALYAKNEMDTLPTDVLKRMRERFEVMR